MSYKLRLFLTLLVLQACSQAPRPGVERVAVIAFENLTNDPAGGWIGQSAADLLVSAAAGAPALYAFSAADNNAALARRPTQILRGYRTESGIEAALQDANTGRTIRLISAKGADPAALGQSIARELWPGARRAASSNPEAVKAYAQALHSAPRDNVAPLLLKALQLDPQFLDAALALQQIDPAAAAAALTNIQPSDAVDRARVELAIARSKGDIDPHIAASQRLAALLPADEEIHAQLASLLFRRRRYAESVKSFENALRAEPENGNLYNDAAYAYAYAGDLGAAVRSVAEYEKRNPASANPKDSLGEVYFVHAKFPEAEAAFLAAYEKEPAFQGSVALRKAALARLLSGDSAGADRLFQRYADAASKHPLIAMFKAQWLYIRGEKNQAMQLVEDSKQSLGQSQLAIWQAMEGQDGRDAAEKAFRMSAQPVERKAAIVAMVLAHPESLNKVQDPNLREETSAYLALTAKRYQDAIPALQRLFGRDRPMEASHWQGLLADAYARSGKMEEARKTLHPWPIPDVTTQNPFESVMWARLMELKGKL